MPRQRTDPPPQRRAFLRALRKEAGAQGWTAIQAARAIHARLASLPPTDLAIQAFLARWRWSPEADGLGADILGDLDVLHAGRKDTGSYYTADDVVEYLCDIAILPCLMDGTLLTLPSGEAITADEAVTRNLPLRELVLSYASKGADDAFLYALRDRLGAIRILDPTCGAGAFLVGALRLICGLQERLRQRLGSFRDEASPSLVGVDLDADALEICRLRLELEGAEDHCRLQLIQADFITASLAGAVDVVIGNPPYVESAANRRPSGLATAGCSNVYSWCMERSLRALNPSGRFGMIVPVSAVAGDDYAPLRGLLLQRECWISTFSNRPAKLFEGVEQRLAIIACGLEGGPLHTTTYQHWRASEREGLLQRLRYVDGETWAGRVVKLGDLVGRSIFHALLAAPNHLGGWCDPVGDAAVWLHDGPTYWIRALAFPPAETDASVRRGHYRRIPVADQKHAYALAAILSSGLFYLWFKAVSNCRDLTRTEWESFPIPVIDGEALQALADLGCELAKTLRDTARSRRRRYPSGEAVYHEYYPARASGVLARIDALLASLYGLDESEQAYVRTQPRGANGAAQGSG